LPKVPNKPNNIWHVWNWAIGRCINCGKGTNDPNLGTICEGDDQSDLFSWFMPMPTTKPARKCLQCGCELCEELDAYYGKDPIEAAQCTSCRLGRLPFKKSGS
jgi:hypothetical protein